ncbi:MAG TPA: chemotaxis protein CheB [Bryobacteraceae bacterium]|nr:chemotaxis protein CheB [Bryobacteraceae bacterium]
MPKRDIVTIGGSAGSVQLLKSIVKSLPADLPAAVFVVIHLSPRDNSMLASVLSTRGGMPVSVAAEGARIEPGRVYVCQRDRHLIVGSDHLHLTRGPKEGLHRPSINATFRSASAAHRERVVGVLLSGMLDDGASGMWEIARNGGVTIVQDPAEALFPSMPQNAIDDAPIHFRARVQDIPALIVRLVGGEDVSDVSAEGEDMERAEKFSGFTCPECRGPLFVSGREPIEFACRVGHVMPLRTLLEEHTSTQERKLYEAIVALEEGADLAEYSARELAGVEKDELEKEATQLRRHSKIIRELIEERSVPPAD